MKFLRRPASQDNVATLLTLFAYVFDYLTALRTCYKAASVNASLVIAGSEAPIKSFRSTFVVQKNTPT